jgi:hypothetical protein
LRQLDALLTWLRQHSIQSNLPKCEFGSKEVTYLGFHLTESGNLLGANKLQEVQKMTPPTTV